MSLDEQRAFWAGKGGVHSPPPGQLQRFQPPPNPLSLPGSQIALQGAGTGMPGEASLYCVTFWAYKSSGVSDQKCLNGVGRWVIRIVPVPL